MTEAPPDARPIDGPTFVYRFYDDAGRLLYVGVALSPASRWQQHERRDWWPEVARIEAARLPLRTDALAEEHRAIHSEHPLHNVHAGTTPDMDRPRKKPPEFTEADRVDLERRVRAGEWLTPGQATVVMGLTRSAVHRWLVRGRTSTGLPFEAKTKPGTKHRLVNPDHVVTALDGPPPES